MKTIDKIIEDLELKDIKRIAEQTGGNVIITQPLNNSKIEFEYDMNGKLLSKTKIKNNGEIEFKYVYKCDNDPTEYFTTTYVVEHRHDNVTIPAIITICYDDINQYTVSYSEFDDSEEASNLKNKTFYSYKKINDIYILTSIDIFDYEAVNNAKSKITEVPAERLVQLTNTSINNMKDKPCVISLDYNHINNEKSHVTININKDGLIKNLYFESDSVSKTTINYDKDGFLSNIKQSFINYLGYEYSTSTVYDYKNMTKTVRTTTCKKNK